VGTQESSEAPLIVALKACPEDARESYGGKARGLFRLSDADFPVPQGWAVLPEAKRPAVEALLRSHPEGPWIVRSSAKAEDSAGQSFAGLFESIPDLATENVWEALQRCRASGSAERVLEYRRSHGLPADDEPIPVVIQRQVEAIASGVSFTLHPLSGRDHEVLIEACRGPGEQLVSGRLSPYRWVLDRDSEGILEEQAGDPDRSPPINRAQLRHLLRTCLEVQALFGSPQDIEWVLGSEGLQLVQSRPITRIHWRMDIGEWTSADFRDGGISSGVCSPFMFGLYEEAVEASMTAYFRALGLLTGPKPQWMNYQYGRGYWNLGAVKKCLMRLPGFDEEDFDRDFGIEKDYGAEGPWRTPATLATLLPALPVALNLEREFLSHRAQLRRFVRDFPRRFRRARTALGPARGSRAGAREALRVILEELQQPVERAYFRTIYNSANLQGEFKKTLAAARAEANHEDPALELFGGLGEIAHFAAERDLYELQDADPLEPALARFLLRHGYRGTRELDITVPRWSEDSAFIRSIIAKARAGDRRRHPDELLRTQQRRFLELRNELASKLSWGSRAWFLLRLRQSRDYLVIRESMRDCSTRAYSVLRTAALALGTWLVRDGLLERTDDLWLLTPREALAWGDLGSQPAGGDELITRRRLKFRGFASPDFDAPGEFGARLKPATAPSDAATLVGIGCSPGRCIAPAFRAQSVFEAAQAPAGAILVAPFTDPGWTPVFARLAGVVTKVGGLLSHAAVLSREYGIPAVLAVPGALQIKTGESLELDGERGLVTRLEHPKPEP